MTGLFDEAAPQATMFADGGSRGNPGPAASGSVVLRPDGSTIAEIGVFLGIATNNVAEWNGLCAGLEAAVEHGIKRLAVRMDSELVVKQIKGIYRVKHPALQPFFQRAKALLRHFEYVDIQHVPRKQNAMADAVVNQVLDREAALQR
ncbi:MAG TPA: ribonuclease HI family protein [Verrucomicrobiae bacterium]|jgi:ribonuclease HI|nr:ribonuclease HI family protein [Verrucomicrobiae bacterium]